MFEISYSYSSRTSRRNTLSPRSRRCFNSSARISPLAQKHKTRLPGHLLAAGHSRVFAFELSRFAISSSQKTNLRCAYRRYNKRWPSGLETSCQKASTNLPEPSASRKEYADDLGLVPS